MNTLIEGPMPQVTFDISLGQELSYIDVDYEAMVDQLKEGNVPDTSIDKLKIHFTSETVSKNGLINYGNYKPKNNTITVRPLSHLDLLKEVVKEDPLDLQNMPGISSAFIENADKQFIDSQLQSNTAETLAHELEHAVISYDKVQKNITNKYRRVHEAQKTVYKLSFAIASSQALEAATDHIVPVYASIGWLYSLATLYRTTPWFKQRQHKIYLNDPDETRCREASENAADDLIKISAK